MKTCHCGQKAIARSLCQSHYNQWHHANRSKVHRPSESNYEELFWSSVLVTGCCWYWTKGVQGGGYGEFHWPSRRTRIVHRIAYELLVGPIPKGLVLDHLCRTRRCVNPDHLEPVTIAENVRRGFRYGRRSGAAGAP